MFSIAKTSKASEPTWSGVLTGIFGRKAGELILLIGGLPEFKQASMYRIVCSSMIMIGGL